MRVIQVTDYGSPFAGSFVPMLRVGLQAMEARGWSTLAVLPPRARERHWLSELGDLPIAFSPGAGRRELAAWLTGLVDAEPGPTILHSHFTIFDLPVAAVARRRPDVTAYWHLHTVLSSRLAIQLRNRVKFSFLSRPVERILCVAPHLAEAVVARGGPPEKVRYFPNGLDVDAYQPVDAVRRAAARDLLGLPADATVLLHFGRNWELKGGDLFLEAFRLLRDEGHEGLVGVSARGGKPARELAARLGLGDSIFTPDAVRDVKDLFAAADLFMATSRAEGMPLSVLEALASGVPVVASDIPGHALPGAPAGALRTVPLAPEQFAHSATDLLGREPARRLADAEAARTWIQEEMGVVDWAARLIDLYERTAPGAR